MLTSKDFELLLPWYLNGTLTERERDQVAAYLREHPEEGAAVQWHSALRSRIKEQAEELPRDLGLERVLITMRRSASKSPNPRPHAGRSWPAHLAGWLISLGRDRGAGAVALASVTLVAGTIAIFVTMMRGPGQSPAPTSAQSGRPPQPAMAEQAGRNEVAAAASPRANEGADSTVALAPPTPIPSRRVTFGAGPSQRTDDRALKGPITPGSQRSLPAPPGPDESNAARRPEGMNQQPASPARNRPERSEPTQVAEAPAGMTTPAPQAGTPKATDSRPLSPGPANGLASASEAPQVEQRSAVADATPAAQGTVPETTRPSSTGAVEREIVSSTRRIAISGKQNTSCPSIDKQREDALRAANPDQPVRTPDAWIEYIKELLKAGCRDAADQQWVEFHKKYPDVQMPPGLETSK